MTNQPEYIIVHTAAYDGGASIIDVNAWHRDRGFHRDKPKNRGALDAIGYHYYIRLNGKVEKGRDETEVGAHCQNDKMNFKSIGICLEGHGDLKPFTKAQESALLDLCYDLALGYPEIHRKREVAILGHREVKGVTKTCPGELVDMMKIRSKFRHKTYKSLNPIAALGLLPMDVAPPDIDQLPNQWIKALLKPSSKPT